MAQWHDSSSNSLNTLQEHLEVFEAMVQDYEANKALNSARFDELTDKGTGISKQLTKHKEAIGTLSGMLENAKAGISYSTSKLSTHDDALIKQDSAILTLNEDVIAIKKEIDKLESQLIAVVNELSAHQTEVREDFEGFGSEMVILKRQLYKYEENHSKQIDKLEDKLNKVALIGSILISALLVYTFL